MGARKLTEGDVLTCRKCGKDKNRIEFEGKFRGDRHYRVCKSCKIRKVVKSLHSYTNVSDYRLFIDLVLHNGNDYRIIIYSDSLISYEKTREVVSKLNLIDFNVVGMSLWEFEQMRGGVLTYFCKSPFNFNNFLLWLKGNIK